MTNDPFDRHFNRIGFMGAVAGLVNIGVIVFVGWVVVKVLQHLGIV